MTMEFLDYIQKEENNNFIRIMLTPNLLLNFNNFVKTGFNFHSKLIKDFSKLLNIQRFIFNLMKEKKELKKIISSQISI